MNQKLKHIGMVWYKREDYDKLRSIFADGHRLPKSYDDWLQKAEQGFNDILTKGKTPVKVYLNPDSFPAWCRARSLNINAAARVEFANDFVGRKYLYKN